MIFLDWRSFRGIVRIAGLVQTILSMGVDATKIAVNLTILHQYLKQDYPDWIMIFKSDTIKMSIEEYEKMSDNGKRAIEKNYNILIKKK